MAAKFMTESCCGVEFFYDTKQAGKVHSPQI